MGKGKVLKTTISLLGKIDPSLTRALSKAQKQSSNAGKSMSKNMKSAGAAMTKTVKGFAKTAVAVFASISAAAKLKEYAQECVTAAKAQIDAETKLETVLKNVESIQIRGPNAAAEAANNLKKVASDIQKTGVIGDEVLLSGMQQLATFQLDDKTISALSTGMADLLAQQKGLNASQTDAVSVANMIGKVMSGSTSALSRIGITFTDEQAKLLKSGDAMKRAATLAEVLQQNVGGVNKALAQTDQGKLQQSENTIGDLKEQIGMKLLPVIANIATKAVPLVEKAFDKVGQVVDKISPHIERLASTAIPLIGKAFDKISGAIDQVAPIAEEMFSFLIDSGKQLEPVFSVIGQRIMVGLGGQLPSIMTVMQTLFGYIQQVTPTIISIVSVIGTAIAPIVSALISVAQMLLPKIMSLIQSLGPLLQTIAPVLNFIGGIIGNVFRSAGVIVSDFIGVITNVINILTNLLQFIGNVFTLNWSGAWENIKAIFINAIGSLGGIVHAALTAIVSPINAIIGGINKVSSAVGIAAIPTIEVPQFADGATVTKPTLAVVGEGSDPETIVPHNNKPRSRRLLANAAAGVGMSIGKGNSYTYAPVIYANNVQGVKEALADDFERFKEYMRQMLGDDDREVFA